jgi:hypothetical protein
MASKQQTAGKQLFDDTREFIKTYSILPNETDYDLVTIWAMGTWTFSPAAPAMPYTYPYLYLTGAKGSGKTLLGKDVFGYVTRNHRALVDVTGATLFRLLGDYDEESGAIVPHYPTLAIDEIDAKYSGAKDEQFRGVADAGYQQGMTVPRSAGKTTMEFPVYSPKCFMGIDNGHLPDTLLDRCIRVDITMATPKQIAGLKELYPWDVEQETSELQQRLADWAKDSAMVLREYNPDKIPGLKPRHWQISRSLVQLAKAIGIEKRIRDALKESFGRAAAQQSATVKMYQSIYNLFTETGADKLTSNQIAERVMADGVALPGNPANPGKGLSAMLAKDGIGPRAVFIDGRSHRGYWRRFFDDAFAKYLMPDED